MIYEPDLWSLTEIYQPMFDPAAGEPDANTLKCSDC